MVLNSVINVDTVYTMTKFLIAVVGPTAIGKTALSIKLANAFDCEIISADSRQFYKEMNIGTAAPTREELNAAPHHFIHNRSVKDQYSVGDFERGAIEQLEKLFQKSDIAIVVGGSGLYLDAIVKGLDEFPDIDENIRKTLNRELNNKGIAFLQNRLKTIDPDSYQSIKIDNPHRLIRALEVSIGSGQPYSSFLSKKRKSRNFKTIYIGLTAPREIIYERINQRVDLMMEQGLLQEVKELQSYKNENALNTVGYKELFNYLEGTWSLQHAVSEIKKNTRRFAKRQLTWYRKNEDVTWFEHKYQIQEIIDFISKQIKDEK